MTKIMNEGWASYWHSTIMTKNALNASEIIDFADHHAGVMAMSKQQINPYKIGIELSRISSLGGILESLVKSTMIAKICQKQNWDLPTNKGREKIFDVRKLTTISLL